MNEDEEELGTGPGTLFFIVHQAVTRIRAKELIQLKAEASALRALINHRKGYSCMMKVEASYATTVELPVGSLKMPQRKPSDYSDQQLLDAYLVSDCNPAEMARALGLNYGSMLYSIKERGLDDRISVRKNTRGAGRFTDSELRSAIQRNGNDLRKTAADLGVRYNSFRTAVYARRIRGTVSGQGAKQ